MPDKTVVVRLEAAIGGYQSAMGQAAGSTKELESQVTSAQSAMGKMGGGTSAQGLTRFGVAAESAGRGLTYTLTPAALAAALAIKSFQDGVDALRAGTGAVGPELDAMTASMSNIGSEVPVSLAKIGEAMAQVHDRTGLTGQGLEDLTKQYAELSRMGQTLSVDEMTRVFGDWSIATRDQSDAMDELFRVSQITGTGMDRIAQLTVQFGAPLREYGYSFRDAALLMGKFQAEGVNIATLMPGLRISLSRFASAGREPQEALAGTIDRIKALGDSSEGTTLAMQTFGKRAGVDMARAIREGRFNLDDMNKALDANHDTIGQANADTLHFTDTLKMWANNLASTLGPVGDVGSMIATVAAGAGPAVLGVGYVIAAVGKFMAMRAASAAATGQEVAANQTLVAALAEVSVATDAAAMSSADLAAAEELAAAAAESDAAAQALMAEAAAAAGVSSGAAEAGMLGVAGSVSGLTAALGVAAIAFMSYKTATGEADEAGKRFADGLTAPIAAADTYADKARAVNDAIRKYNELIDQKNANDDARPGGGNNKGEELLNRLSFGKLFGGENDGPALDAKANEGAAALKKAQDELQKYNDTIKSVAANTGMSTDMAEQWAKKLGLDPAKVSVDELTGKIKAAGGATNDAVQTTDEWNASLKQGMSGAMGIVRAQDELAKSTLAIGKAQENVTKANEKVVDANRALVASGEKVKDAEQGVRDAIDKRTAATLKVADAEQALRDVENGGLTARKDTVDIAQAQQDIAEAKQKAIDDQAKLRLDQGNGSGADIAKDKLALSADAIDMAKKQLALEQAEGAQGKQLKKAQDDLTKANQDLDSANRDVDKATRAVRDAQYDQERAAIAVKDAQNGVRDALQSVRDAEQQAAEKVVDLNNKMDEQNQLLANTPGLMDAISARMDTLIEKYPQYADALKALMGWKEDPSQPGMTLGRAVTQTAANPYANDNPNVTGRRALGGPVKGYKVNEYGTSELYQDSAGNQTFIPNRDGKIVPAVNVTSGASGGSQGPSRVSHWHVAAGLTRSEVAQEMALAQRREDLTMSVGT